MSASYNLLNTQCVAEPVCTMYTVYIILTTITLQQQNQQQMHPTTYGVEPSADASHCAITG